MEAFPADCLFQYKGKKKKGMSSNFLRVHQIFLKGEKYIILPMLKPLLNCLSVAEGDLYFGLTVCNLVRQVTNCVFCFYENRPFPQVSTRDERK